MDKEGNCVKISVTGGQIEFKRLTNDLSEEDFAICKAFIWLKMLNDNMKPIKWLKTTKKGTKVNFETIKSLEEYKQGLKELTSYIQEVNEKFGSDLKIKHTNV